MKMCTLLRLGLTVVWLTALPAWGQDGLRYTIQVSTFENQSGWSGQWDLGSAWDAVLTDTLQNSGRFIVEQDLRGGALDEQDFANSERTAGGRPKPGLGRMTSAQLLVTGAITEFDLRSGKGSRRSTKISGWVYVVNASTGTVIGSKGFEATFRSKGKETRGGYSGVLGRFKKTLAGKVISKAMVDVMAFLGSQLDGIPWSATVVRGGSDNIIINRGIREGILIGMRFHVGKIEEVRDPDTGELLDQRFTETGVIEVTQVKEKLAYCKKVSGQAPQKGQRAFASPPEY